MTAFTGMKHRTNVATSVCAGNTWNLIKVYQAIRDAVNNETDRIVPGHDPELFIRHPVFEAGHHPVAEVHLADGRKSQIV